MKVIQLFPSCIDDIRVPIPAILDPYLWRGPASGIVDVGDGGRR